MSGRHLETAKAWFRSEGWAFDEAAAGPVLRLKFDGKNGSWFCFAEAREDVFLFYSLCAEGVSPARVPATLEFISRANAQLVVGNFELDFAHAAVRFRTSVDVEGGELSSRLVQNVALANVVTVDRYLPGLGAVLQGDAPERAIPPRVSPS